MIDQEGTLRQMVDEDLMTMENCDTVVQSVADLPPEKLALLKQVDEAGNRRFRKRKARMIGVNWHEYQIYVAMLKSQEV